MRRNLSFIILGAVCFFLTPTVLFAQKNPQQTIAELRSDNSIKEFHLNSALGTPASLFFKQDNSYKAGDVVTLLEKYFGTSQSQLFTLKRSDQLKNGIRVDRYQESFKGIRVEHAAYVAVFKADKLLSITAESYNLSPDFIVTPQLTPATATEKALDFVHASRYAWQEIENEISKSANNPARVQQLIQLEEEYKPKAELVIAKDLYGDGLAKLAYKFNIYALEPLSRSLIYVDAETGRILLVDPIIKHTVHQLPAPSDPYDGYITPMAPVPQVPFNLQYSFKISDRVTTSELGTGHTRYAGTRNIYTTRLSVPLAGMNDPNNTSVPLQYSGVDPRVPVTGPIDVFILKDDTRGDGIATFDMNGVGGLPVSVPALQTQALAMVDKDNDWKDEVTTGTNEDHIRGATSNGSIGSDEASNDDIALDAHWGAEMVYDYWLSHHNRYSFDNNNGAINSFVHYGPAYDNAFWNGSVMTYGDGSGTTAAGFRPLTSLDVCGHEIGHGVCSYTSDLVYASESGAMNEGLSDIWAACIERFVKTSVDNTLPYQYFQVGEQIAPDNVGLRRMDNPKAYTNPDTYGGRYWANPVCTPTLANDECGVHNNSGVLNKWFYLIVQGPGTTTGSPGYTDDGIADAGTAAGQENLGNNYGILGPSGSGEFLGIGFDQAEAIVYLAEQMLTPSATFADARIASIAAAKILYGECSQAEKTVTDAWYGVNVGASYAGCTAPLLSAYSVLSTINEAAVGGCPRYRDYKLYTNLTTAQLSPVVVLFNASGGTLGAHEYQLLQNSVTYNIGETGLKTVTLRLFDDAMVEGNESLQITASSVSPVFNQVITITITDDDINPTIGGVVTLLNENFESTPTTGVPAGWAEVDQISPSPVKWEVETYQSGVLTWTGKRAIIEVNLTSPTTDGIAVYDQLTDAQTILKTPLINAAGLKSVRVQFTYNAGGEPACSPACDYGQLVYSFDGTNFSPFIAGTTPVMYAQFTDANFDFKLPPTFEDKQFYLGVLWNNDANAGTSSSITIDNFLVTAQGRAIETELGDNVSEVVPNETGKPIHFYAIADGDIIASLTNNTAHDYSCVTASVVRAGTSAFELYNDGVNKHRVGDKILRFSPVVNNPAGSYNISLYFTEQEIAAIEAFTSLPRTSFKIYKVTGAVYTNANPGNTTSVAATYTAIPGAGGKFSASFSTGFSDFALGAAVSLTLPVDCIDFKGVKGNNGVDLIWKVTSERDNSKFEIERSIDGVTYTRIGTVNANPSSSGNYQFKDLNIGGLGDAYYRLKQIDFNGTYHYICSVVRVNLKSSYFDLGQIYPNPGRDEALIHVYTDKAMKLQIEYINISGQRINMQSEVIQSGTSTIKLRLNAAAGSYKIQFRNEKGELLGSRNYLKL